MFDSKLFISKLKLMETTHSSVEDGKALVSNTQQLGKKKQLQICYGRSNATS